MREITVNAGDQTRTIAVDGRTLQAGWTIEAQEDLAKNHDVNIAVLLAESLVKEVNFELTANNEDPLTFGEQVDLGKKIKLAVQ